MHYRYLTVSDATSLPAYLRYLAYASTALFDLLLAALIAVTSYSIFARYLRLSRVAVVPFRYRGVLMLYGVLILLAQVSYTTHGLLADSEEDDNVFNTLWAVYLYALAVVFVVFAALLLPICCRMIGYHRGLCINERVRALSGEQRRDKLVFRKMAWTVSGLIVYALNVVSVVLCLFVRAVQQGQMARHRVTRTLWWRIQVHLVGHCIALCSLWCYLRPIRTRQLSVLLSTARKETGGYTVVYVADDESAL